MATAAIERCRYETERLRVGPWTDLTAAERADLAGAILTPAVTATLPAHWRGVYDRPRSQAWVADRDAEGVTLVAVERGRDRVVALVLLGAEEAGTVRLGYLVDEGAWGQGLATEIVCGFVTWCAGSDVDTVVAGVAADNEASIRVLTKAGFEASPAGVPDGAIELVWPHAPRPATQ